MVYYSSDNGRENGDGYVLFKTREGSNNIKYDALLS
jgi:hypothetical protein